VKIRAAGAKFYEDRRMARRDKANGRFSQFCEGAWKRIVNTGPRSM